MDSTSTSPTGPQDVSAINAYRIGEDVCFPSFTGISLLIYFLPILTVLFFLHMHNAIQTTNISYDPEFGVGPLDKKYVGEERPSISLQSLNILVAQSTSNSQATDSLLPQSQHDYQLYQLAPLDSGDLLSSQAGTVNIVAASAFFHQSPAISPSSASKHTTFNSSTDEQYASNTGTDPHIPQSFSETNQRPNHDTTALTEMTYGAGYDVPLFDSPHTITKTKHSRISSNSVLLSTALVDIVGYSHLPYSPPSSVHRQLIESFSSNPQTRTHLSEPHLTPQAKSQTKTFTPHLIHSLRTLDPRSLLYCPETIHIEKNTIHCEDSNTEMSTHIFSWRPFTCVCCCLYVMLICVCLIFRVYILCLLRSQTPPFFIV